MTKNKLWGGLAVVALLLGIAFLARGGNETEGSEEKAAAEYERGPHHGRMLREEDFALEVIIFEDNVPPQFHFYAYDDDQLLDPKEVQMTVTLSRLDGEVNVINFTPEGDYLKGDSAIVEPHSFDVKVKAAYDGNTYTWDYASYEGRTRITPEAAGAAGIVTEQAGPAVIRETVPLTGRILLNADRTARVTARFPGIVREVMVTQGETVAKGAVLARIESNDSLQTYALTAPTEGVILQRTANVGMLTGDRPLFTVADLSSVWAEFHVFARQADQVVQGQKVTVQTAEGLGGVGSVTMVLPVAESLTQTLIARVPLENPQGKWRPGMMVTGEAVIREREVPLTVKNSGLQRFRGFNVVFAHIGDMYEVRMLELGASDGERTEVLSGLKAGQAYVTDNSFLIKADIEKSGASHDH